MFVFLFSFSAQGLDHIAENILSFLDARSLCSAELVCKEWQRVISEGMLWKKLIERMVRTDPLWKGLSERHQWWEKSRFFSHAKAGQMKNKCYWHNCHYARFPREKYLFKNRTAEVPPNSYYHSLYPKIIQDIEVSPQWTGLVYTFVQPSVLHHRLFCFFISVHK